MLRIIISFVFVTLLIIPVYLSHVASPSEEKTGNESLDSALKKFGFYFEEVSARSGVDFKHHSPKLDPLIDPILPEIASTGASVSVVDFDKDGWNDFYVTNSCFGYKNALFHNQKDGSFTDVAEKMGVAELNKEGKGVSMGTVWADYDNDGYDDLFVYKWGKPELFKNDHGTGFTNVTDKSGLPAWINSNCAIWFDYNSDGYVDLFIGGYFREDIDLWHLKTTKILTESFEYSENGGRSYLFKNLGNGTFTDVTKEAGLISNKWTYAAGAVDVNQDGYPDLFIANDYGISELFFNDSGKRFVERGRDFLVGLTPKSGMNVSFGDTYNKGHFGFYVSNITEPGVLLQGNNFWVPLPDKDKTMYVNSAGETGIESGGWSYGAQFADFNNDGYQDLYLANGFISGKKDDNYWYDYSKVTGANAAIISDVKNWPAIKGRSHSGYQQNKIWLNDGNGHFTDVAKYVAESEEFDSRSVAVADLWNRGVQDVLVANQNNRLLIYKNNADPANNWIAFDLEGSRSNRSAIGAIVKLYWDSKVQSQVVTAGIGFCSQNQHRIQFGIGKSTKTEKVEIYWPDGSSQVIENPVVNGLNRIKENQ